MIDAIAAMVNQKPTILTKNKPITTKDKAKRAKPSNE